VLKAPTVGANGDPVLPAFAVIDPKIPLKLSFRQVPRLQPSGTGLKPESRVSRENGNLIPFSGFPLLNAPTSGQQTTGMTDKRYFHALL